MQWYDPFLIMIVIAGILLIALSHYHEKKWMVGLILIIIVVTIKVLVWVLRNF